MVGTKPTTPVAPVASIVRPTVVSPTPASASAVRKAPAQASMSSPKLSDVMIPSDEFIKWCKDSLKGMSGVNCASYTLYSHLPSR